LLYYERLVPQKQVKRHIHGEKEKRMYMYGVELLLWTETFERENISLIGHAKELGFDGVEIHLRYSNRIPVKEIKEALREHGMEVSFVVIFTEEYNCLSDDFGVRERSLEYFKRCIDVAHSITGEVCVVGGVNYASAGYIIGRARTEEEWERSVTNFREAARYAGERGITLAVEPINRFETFFLGFFHACENDRGTPGTGLVQWDEVYRGLRDAGYTGWIVIESFVPDIEELARVCAVWRQLAPSADYLAGEGLKNLRSIKKKTARSTSHEYPDSSQRVN
jgi:D-psicose/D-tagatose/L-ribulose 3-epimerase